MRDLKFKVGDEVYLKGTITSVDKIDATSLSYQVKVHDDLNEYYCMWWTSEKLVFSSDEMKTDKNIIDKLFDEFSNCIARITEGDLIDVRKRMNIFGYTDFYDIMTCLKPAEIISMVREYDAKHTINVGDFVTNPNFGTGVVLEICEKTDTVHLLAENGNVRLGFTKNSLTKTGRTIDISKMLKELREED